MPTTTSRQQTSSPTKSLDKVPATNSSTKLKETTVAKNTVTPAKNNPNAKTEQSTSALGQLTKSTAAVAANTTGKK